MNDRERAEREFVLRRDRMCVLRLRDPLHVCMRMGTAHHSDRLELLTVEHVKERMLVGVPLVKEHKPKGHRIRAKSDRRHMVAMCLDANVAVPSQVVREWIREYLAKVNA